MIKLTLYEKKFSDNLVLKNLNLVVKPGDIVHITGKSGIGKTTLMRILMGLDKDFKGEIQVSTDKISASFPERVFLGHITAFNEVKVLTGADDLAIENAFKELDLYEAREKKASAYSTGMRSRLSIMRAMLSKSELIFLDEPLIGLDALPLNLSKNFIKNNLFNRTLIYTGEYLNFNERDFNIEKLMK